MLKCVTPLLFATMNRVLASKWDKRHGTTLHANMERPAAGMAENRSLEMSVEMLSFSSAAEVSEVTPDGGTMQGQYCHKEHPMFKVSAPPKPQTPGPSRPTPPTPHEGRLE